MKNLIESGYTLYSDFKHVFEVHNKYYKRVNNPLVQCEENDDRISFQCIEYAVYGNVHPQYELSICFCKNGKWWDLKAYSINQSDFTKEMIEKTEQELINIFLSI